MTSMGEKLTEAEVEEMIQFADCEAQGEINYKGEFILGLSIHVQLLPSNFVSLVPFIWHHTSKL